MRVLPVSYEAVDQQRLSPWAVYLVIWRGERRPDLGLAMASIANRLVTVFPHAFA